MSLQGTIKDFGLPDIFQLIGIQRKTGVLTLDNGDDRVTLKFLEGQVVGADTRTESLEERLGEVLVRTGRLEAAQLNEALQLQKSTLQRLGYILVSQGHISEEDLVEALAVQSSQIIYRLFRWREGNYHFDRVEDMEYDEAHFTPIASETILMEGARMIDEWPIIERRIRSDRMVLRKTEALLALQGEAVAPVADEGVDVDLDLEFDLDLEIDQALAAAPVEQKKKKDKPLLSPEECEVIAMIDGRRTVRAVADLSMLSEFDMHRILSDLVTRGMLEEVTLETPEQVKTADWPRRVVGALAHGLVLVLALGALASLSLNPWTPWRLLAADSATGRLRQYASLERLEKLEKALRVYYLHTGTIPDSLASLAPAGYLRADELVDPWGRAYSYRVSSGGYVLQGYDVAGESTPALTVARRFTDAQRLLLPDENPSVESAPQR